MNNFSQYTAADLLEKIIEFTNMTPNPKDWSFEVQMKNDPRFIRLQQIRSLFWAFTPELYFLEEMQESIENFYSGEFISNRKIENYHKLVEKIDKTISKSTFCGAPKKKIVSYDLQNNYRDLLNYYLKLNRLVNHNKGIMEISYPYFFPYIVTNSISDSISLKAGKLKTILALFIDPNKRRITEDELIKNFDYPTEDLFEIDMDWK